VCMEIWCEWCDDGPCQYLKGGCPCPIPNSEDRPCSVIPRHCNVSKGGEV